MNLPLFLIPILVGSFTQLLKYLFNKHWVSDITIHGIHMPRYGGMPSAHTAFAFSLLTTVAVVDGVFSTAMVIAVAITIFILDDALRMRIFLERHGLAIRELIKNLPEQQHKNYPQLEARLGHKPAEVLVGALIGVFLTLAILLVGNY